MPLRIMMSFIAAFVMVALTSMAPAQAFDTEAKQAILLDAATHTVLFQKNADDTMTPSSMSKLMTLHVAFDRLKQGSLKLTDEFPVSEKAWRMGGSKTFVALNSKVSVEDLLQGIIVQSGNDACVVLAEGLSGSEEVFAEQMNKDAVKLGLTGSHFVNSTGWPDPNHVMTARDLAILSEHLIEDFPEYYKYFAEREFTYNNITQQNRNPLLGSDLGVDGLKTGHTEDGGYGIAISAKRGEQRLILVVNGLESPKAREEESRKLLQYGFQNFESQTLLRAGEILDYADVWMGKDAQVPLIATKDIALSFPRSAKRDIVLKLKYNNPIPAPITEGMQIATLSIEIPDMPVMEVPLTAGKAVESLLGPQRILPVLGHWLGGK
ncbi:MAG: D-alanyl-D-alanine carboxypeptidase [Alphaproteobacteria bacterium]|nr:D-alanyl-D-alanine carboxypeptidase [Alphaproteobacteria bacterium]